MFLRCYKMMLEVLSYSKLKLAKKHKRKQLSKWCLFNFWQFKHQILFRIKKQDRFWIRKKTYLNSLRLVFGHFSKNLAGGRMDGKVDGWVGVEAILRIANSNKKIEEFNPITSLFWKSNLKWRRYLLVKEKVFFEEVQLKVGEFHLKKCTLTNADVLSRTSSSKSLKFQNKEER